MPTTRTGAGLALADPRNALVAPGALAAGSAAAILTAVFAVTLGLTGHTLSRQTILVARTDAAGSPTAIRATRLAGAVRGTALELVANLSSRALAATHSAVVATFQAVTRWIFRARGTIDAAVGLAGSDTKDVPVLCTTRGELLADAGFAATAITPRLACGDTALG